MNPVSINSNRIYIRHLKEDELVKDGVIELRRGIPDISLEQYIYAQVRIAVDGEYYLKGMALYGDDIPNRVDIVVNTSKPEEVFKPMKDNLANPFGVWTRQMYYVGADGEKHQSALNIVSDDGDWGDWDKLNTSSISWFISRGRPPHLVNDIPDNLSRDLLYLARALLVI